MYNVICNWSFRLVQVIVEILVMLPLQFDSIVVKDDKIDRFFLFFLVVQDMFTMLTNVR